MEALPPAPPPNPPADADSAQAANPQAGIEWYHPDPDAPYHELRLGVTPGVTRALLVGGGVAVGMIALMFVILWLGWLRHGSPMPVPN